VAAGKPRASGPAAKAAPARAAALKPAARPTAKPAAKPIAKPTAAMNSGGPVGRDDVMIALIDLPNLLNSRQEDGDLAD
jgi:hypothetical protein